MILRVLRTGPSDPCLNMGFDEALLLGVGSPATLRLYQWRPAGVSLGYFQANEPFRELPGDHVLVRRLTGGGAIYHGDEITFSLALDAGLLPEPIADSYALIHDAIHAALGDVGVVARRAPPTGDVPGGRRRTPTGDALRARPDQPWCFAEPTDCDLVAPSGGKLLGSAQRRIRRPHPRVLHHGSLVLRAPAATPFCGSVAETADPASIETDLTDAIVNRLAQALDLEPRSAEPTPAERDHAMELRDHRYAAESFIFRR